jgi:quinol-cytochrome oxidoreductase complex cytochrome b subunit
VTGPRARGRWGRGLGAAVRQSRVYRSVVRTPGYDSPAGRALQAFGNVFLHVYPVRVPRALLGLRATWRLGFVSAVLYGVLLATGVALMFVYTPAVTLAYPDMVRLRTSVGFGQFLRNAHRWGAHLMVLAVALHLVRVFVHGAYKRPREFNWVVGVALFVVTLLYSFTGYLLPWDQLSYWAVTVGTDLLQYVPLAGGTLRDYVLGGRAIGQATLLRFYVLHVMVLTAALFALLAVHIWRVRKDGLAVGEPGAPGRPRERADGRADGRAEGRPRAGAPAPAAAIPPAAPAARDGSPPRERTLGVVRRPPDVAADRDPADQVFTWPHLLVRHQVAALVTVVLVVALALAFDAPLRDLANPNLTPPVAKAPWYFVGLQELLAHFDPVIAGVLIPGGALAAMLVLPYVDRNPARRPRARRFAMAAFALLLTATVGLTVVGALFRGPGWRFVKPWEELYFEP